MADLDEKRIAAFEELPPAIRRAIRAALTKPERLGAFVDIQGNGIVRCSLGWVVTSGFVTPLGAELVEAINWRDASLLAA